MPEAKLTVLLSAEQIQARIHEIADQIDKDYEGKGPLYMLCVLKGAIFYYSDLARAIKHPVRMDFIGLSSYGQGKATSGEVRITKDLDTMIEGCDILIVEDILDSGITLSYLVQILQQRKPRSIRITTLLDKPERRVRPVMVDYVGFRIPDAFVVGYGLDFDSDYRQLKDVCVLGE